MDNIFVYQPLPHVKTLYYLDVNFYRYFIGRDDQSVNEKVMIGRIDQQIRVTKLMLGYYDVTRISCRKLRRYMTNYLEIMMTVSSILAIRSDSEENLKKKKELWQYLKEQNLKLYLRLRWGFLGQGVNLPGKSGRKVSVCLLYTSPPGCKGCRNAGNSGILYGLRIRPYHYRRRIWKEYYPRIDFRQPGLVYCLYRF